MELFKNDLEEPRAIAVDPELGLIFWTDWGKRARIERSGMDGQYRMVSWKILNFYQTLERCSPQIFLIMGTRDDDEFLR